MKDLKDKEKVVRDLVNTFNDRDDLHIQYKKRMQAIICTAIVEYLVAREDIDNELEPWVHNFVEERFKPM